MIKILLILISIKFMKLKKYKIIWVHMIIYTIPIVYKQMDKLIKIKMNNN